MKRKLIAVICSFVIGLSVAGTANAATIAEIEGNDTFGTAQDLSGSFTPASDPDIFGTLPTASVIGSNSADSDVDYFTFMVASSGIGYFDIDYGMFGVDTTLALFDSGYNLLAYVDDSFPTDPGSAHGYDSFLGVYSFTSGGQYYIAVSDYANFPLATGTYDDTLTRPDGYYGGISFLGDSGPTSVNTSSGGYTYSGGTYTLHVSIENPGATVPEPSTLMLLGAGFAGLALIRRSRKA